DDVVVGGDEDGVLVGGDDEPGPAALQFDPWTRTNTVAFLTASNVSGGMPSSARAKATSIRKPAARATGRMSVFLVDSVRSSDDAPGRGSMGSWFFSLPRRGCIPQPRVAAPAHPGERRRHPGSCSLRDPGLWD